MIDGTLRRSQHFFSSYSFYEGLRLTIGILIPVLISIYFGQLSWGVSAALGALAIGITDVAGPLHHRKNGMLAGIILIFSFTIITALVRDTPILLGVWLLLASFACSFIGVFGNRASQVGSAGLLIIVLLTDTNRHIDSIFLTALVSTIGGVLYFLISITFQRIRPYKLAQQSLGKCIEETMRFLKVKAKFYEQGNDYQQLYTELLAAQNLVNNTQQEVREILFKTRAVVKESTHTGRVLVMSFIDTVDLFESIVATQPNYEQMHKFLKGTPLMDKIKHLLDSYVYQLDHISLAFEQGNAYTKSDDHHALLQDIESTFTQIKAERFTRQDIKQFLDIRQVLEAMHNLNKRIQTLKYFTTYDKGIRINKKVDYRQFVIPTFFNKQLIISNLSIKSNIMRFAVRMALAMMAGYFTSLLLPLGHNYWLLLTIAVILKPAYAITKKRNTDRLLGTALGVGIGYGILSLVNSTTWLFVLFIIFMIGAFSFMRNKYFVSVAMLTVFVLIAFQLLTPGAYNALLIDRLIDTTIGSIIAAVFTIIIPPLWEKYKLTQEAVLCLNYLQKYFISAVATSVDDNFPLSQYKVDRKRAFVQMANCSDAFQRMTNEPKLVQSNAIYWHQFVVSSHVLIAHIATISAIPVAKFSTEVQLGVKQYQALISRNLSAAIAVLNREYSITVDPNQLSQDNNTTSHWQAEIDQLFTQRTEELKQRKSDSPARRRLKDLQGLAHSYNNVWVLSAELKNICIKVKQNAN